MKEYLWAGLICLVAGCQTEQQESLSSASAPSLSSASLPNSTSSSMANDVAAGTAAASTRTETSLKSEQLIGRSRDELSKILGQPRRIRRDPGLEVWQYGSSLCMVELYLYGADQSYRVVYVEARDYSASLVRSEECLPSLPSRQI